MKRSLILLLALFAGTALAAFAPAWPPPQGRAEPPGPKLIVHEWGTFLSVQGSDGQALGGMVDSEEELPKFVYDRGGAAWDAALRRKRATMFSKMETPVTYFYVDQPMIVHAKVRMPEGLLTHWYPVVSEIKPTWKPNERLPEDVGSSLNWGAFWVYPQKHFTQKNPAPALPAVGSNEPWRFVRETDSALLAFRTGAENPKEGAQHEKFLFYRGLGEFKLPIYFKAQGRDDALKLEIFNQEQQPIVGAIALQVADGHIRFARLNELTKLSWSTHDLGKTFSEPKPLAEGVPLAKAAVEAELVKAGLYPKEAAAMCNNWEKSYFATPGTRLLHIVPRTSTDALIPIEISPQPTELVRVMVGRTELLTPDREAALLKSLEQLADPKTKAEGEAFLASLGRLREPALRRAQQLAGEKGAIRAQIDKLLAVK